MEWLWPFGTAVDARRVSSTNKRMALTRSRMTRQTQFHDISLVRGALGRRSRLPLLLGLFAVCLPIESAPAPPQAGNVQSAAAGQTGTLPIWSFGALGLFVCFTAGWVLRLRRQGRAQKAELL